MNSLNRALARGDIVVVSNDIFPGQEYPLFERAFVVESGRGTSAVAEGQELFGYWLAGNQPDVVPGDRLDAEETKRFNEAREAKLRGDNGHA